MGARPPHFLRSVVDESNPRPPQLPLQLAAARLRDSDAKLIEIALDVGYESEAAFSRAFRRVVGVAPGAWRRARRGTAKQPAAIPR